MFEGTFKLYDDGLGCYIVNGIEYRFDFSFEECDGLHVWSKVRQFEW